MASGALMSSGRRTAVAAATATIVGALIITLRPSITRALLRHRIRRMQGTLDALRQHAATARALCGAYSDQRAHRERIQALRQVQRRTLSALEHARELVDANLLRLREASTGEQQEQNHLRQQHRRTPVPSSPLTRSHATHPAARRIFRIGLWLGALALWSWAMDGGGSGGRPANAELVWTLSFELGPTQVRI